MQRARVRGDFAQDISEFASTWGIKCYKNRKIYIFSNVFQVFYISSMNNWNNAFFCFLRFLRLSEFLSSVITLAFVHSLM